MFEINLISMGQAAEELKKAEKQLNRCLDEISRSTNTLKRFSYMNAPLKNLRGIQQQVEEESSGALHLEKTLETICHLYRKTEQMLIDECEQTMVYCRRERTDYYHMDWLSDFLEKEIL